MKYNWEDPKTFKINKEDGHVIAMPFDSFDEAVSGSDSEYGLFACWGLGIHLITNGEYYDGYGDNFLEDNEAQTLKLGGHYGDAYGEFSIFMVDRDAKAGFLYVCSGTECDYYNEPSYGEYSENWIWEEEMVTALYENIFNAE